MTIADIRAQQRAMLRCAAYALDVADSGRDLEWWRTRAVELLRAADLREYDARQAATSEEEWRRPEDVAAMAVDLWERVVPAERAEGSG